MLSMKIQKILLTILLSLWYNTMQFNLFQEESVPRVPPLMRVCDRAVQNTPVVYYTVGIKDPAASFFNREAVTGYYYIHN